MTNGVLPSGSRLNVAQFDLSTRVGNEDLYPVLERVRTQLQRIPDVENLPLPALRQAVADALHRAGIKDGPSFNAKAVMLGYNQLADATHNGAWGQQFGLTYAAVAPFAEAMVQYAEGDLSPSAAAIAEGQAFDFSPAGAGRLATAAEQLAMRQLLDLDVSQIELVGNKFHAKGSDRIMNPAELCDMKLLIGNKPTYITLRLNLQAAGTNQTALKDPETLANEIVAGVRSSL